jgi:tetratricopeptide (TPR) repeat protein
MGRAAFVLFGAIVLTAVAGCPNSPPAASGQPHPDAVTPPAKAPLEGKRGQTALDASAVRSRLVVRKVAKENDTREIVILGRPTAIQDIPEYNPPTRPDMLPREMVRQAVLIAARDELGLATRDEVIDETPVDLKEQVGGVVEVVSYIRDNRSHEMIRRVKNDESEIILAHETPTPPGRDLDLLKLLVSAEALSRQEFPNALKGLGLAGKPNAVKDEAGLPEKVEDRLTSVEFLDALLAVRDVHRAIRNDGESPSRLGALARGYALLGVLSEFHWHPAHRAFKGRALLYAQRLVARSPDQPWSLWNRAFAQALFGRHGNALADLDEAKKKTDAKGAATAPEWVEVIDAFCRYDSPRLERVEGPQKKLAALLRMFTLAFPRTTAAGLRAADAVVMMQPFCFRAHDAMSDFTGVSTQHVTTMIAPQALDAFIAKKLPAVAELPASVKDRLSAHRPIIEVAGLLDKAGAPEDDTGEPAWGVLGHMIRETRFVQVYRRLYFMRFMLAVPTDGVWNEVRADVTDHRYRPYLELVAVPGPGVNQSAQKFVDGLELVDIETTESAMNLALWNLGRPKAKAAWEIAMAHEDSTAEMALSLWQAQETRKADIAQEILKVSPYHSFARATLINNAWDAVKEQVPAWEKESGASPALLAALGLHYSAAKQYDDAQRVISRYIELSPDAWAYQTLAQNFKAQGRIDRWQATLDEFLAKVEDLGLDHAKVRVEVADHYMALKEWDKAKPYAEAAAQTGAGWAMECAGRCAEGQKDWERAESWYSSSTERYPNDSWGLWYLFCKRTGHGNLEAAREFADQYVTSHANRPDMLNPELAGCFFWLDGRIEPAKKAFSKAFPERASVSAGLRVAMIADDEKDASRRDSVLKEIVTKHRDQAPKTVAACQLLVDTVFEPSGKKPLDIAALDQLIESTQEDGRGNICFFVGWFLKNHGDATNSKKYLERASQSPLTFIWYRYLADQALKQFSAH